MTIGLARAEAPALDTPRAPTRSTRVLLPEMREVVRGERARVWERAAPRALPTRAAQLEPAARVHVVAALLAVLHRYAQQSELALDVFVSEPSHGERAFQLDLVLDGDMQFASLRAQASMALSQESCLRERAEVALSFAHTIAAREGAVGAASVVGHAEHALHLVVHALNGRSVLSVAYDASRFQRETIESVIESLLSLLERADGESTLAELPLLSRQQSEAILEVCDGGSAHEEHSELVHQRFERFAREQPDALAVRCRERQLSYGELDERAARLAHYLAARGVKAETMVAVCLTPCVEVLVALLAIFKAGGVYVPLDPTHPPALIASILEETAPAVVLTCRSAAHALPAELACFCFEDDWNIVEHVSPLARVASVCADQPCYVLYTSGTTGRPKGVVASQENLAHYLGVARERYGFTRSDRFCSLARYTFSISFFELLSPLTCGGSLTLLTRDEVLDPACLARELEQSSVLHAGPSLLANLMHHLRKQPPSARFAQLRHVSTGGDLVPPALLEELKGVFERAELFVIYGCTEVSCMGCTAQVSRAHAITRTFVGRPFEDVRVRVLDGHGNLVPFGVVGEVYFAGRGLARRYLHRPELTSERFVAIDGQRFYRTGDLGRLSPDGQLELLGRSDFQVKLRGIRVELTGIEHAVRELRLAEQCAVVAAQYGDNDLRLVAFLVRPSAHDGAAMRALLAQHLPDYMLPQAFVVLASLPLTHNGKLDRRALQQLAAAPLPTSSEGADDSAGELVGATEHVVAEAFAKVLKLGALGRDADFFLLGGHSLMAVLVAEELADKLGRRVSPALLFEHSKVRALALALASADDASTAPILLSDSDDRPALFMLLGVHLYRELASELEGHYSVYGVYAASELALLDQAGDACTVEELARDYIASISAQQPHGPYRIGGMSFGGVVAYEVAQQLERAGHEVEQLLLLDALLPQSRWQRARRLLTTPALTALDLVGQRTLARLAQAPRAPAEAVLGMVHDDSALQSLEELRQAAYRAAATKYARAARPYAGEVTLVVAGERLASDPLLDPSCGFAPLVENLSIHTLPAEHLGLLEQPAVADVAACVLEDTRRFGRRSCVVPMRTSVLTSV